MRAFLLATAAAIGLAGCTTGPAPAASAPPAQTAPVANEDARIADLVARMSIERKVAQLIQPQIGSFTAADMRRYRFGSYLNGGTAAPMAMNSPQPRNGCAMPMKCISPR